MDKKYYCELILTYKSGTIRYVNAFGGRTYNDAKKIGENYMKTHKKVESFEIYRYGYLIKENEYLKNLIN